MSSKWNRPMRRFQSAQLTCQKCGQAIKPGQFGGWEHVARVGIKDPSWHLVAA